MPTWLVALILAVAACSGGQAPEPGGDVALRATPAVVRPGDTVTLTLNNGSSETVAYNLCLSRIERIPNAEVMTERVCTMELRLLQPRGRASYSYELPGDLAAYRYRFLTAVERMPAGGRTTVRSNTIEVR